MRPPSGKSASRWPRSRGLTRAKQHARLLVCSKVLENTQEENGKLYPGLYESSIHEGNSSFWPRASYPPWSPFWDWYVERFAQYLGILVCCTRARKPGADNVLGLRRLMGTIVEEAPFPRYTPPPMKMGKEGRAHFHPLTGGQFSVYRLEFR